MPILLSKHEARAKQDKDFQDLVEDVAEAKLQRRKNDISLNEAERRDERTKLEAKIKAREARKLTAVSKATGGDPVTARDITLRDDGLQADERKLANLLAAEKVRKEAKHVLLEEAARILGDGVALSTTDGRFAIRLKQSSTTVPN